MLLSTFKGLPTYNKSTLHWHIHQTPICEHDHVPWELRQYFWQQYTECT